MSENTKLWYLQNFNLFDELDQPTLMDLNARTRMTHNRKKEIIYFPEEPSNTIYFLKEGKIKITRLSDEGQSVTIALLGPGEIFGETALLGQDVHENIAEVVEDALICVISKSEFEELLRKSPHLNRSIYTYIGKRLREVESKIEDLVFKDATERVLAFLKRYAENFGKKLVDSIEVRPFLTHQEIADLTATTRQTVNSILNDLKQQQKIDFTRQYLRVYDFDSLL